MNEMQLQVLLVVSDPQEAESMKPAFCWGSGRACELGAVTRLSEAIERLTLDPPDVVVLDLFLADSRGLETLRQLHLAAAKIPVVVLARVDDESLALRALQNGAQDYLVKGEFGARDMSRALRYALERHRLHSALEALTVTDELTHLHNRRGFLSIASHQIDLARRNHETVAIVFADLDGLKEINDQLGHGVGDGALLEVAGILRKSFRQSDVLARFGGDEFAVLAIDPGPPGSALLVQRLRRELQARNRQPGRRYLLSLSVGIEWGPGGKGETLTELLARADAEMYKRKRQHRGEVGRVVFAQPAELMHPARVLGQVI